jgi:hypothetical protein
LFIICRFDFGTKIALIRDIMLIRRHEMNFKQTTAFAGSLLILGLGGAIAQSRNMAENRKMLRNSTQTRAQFQTRFVDENGDGINDLFRDHDNDGIPNCQDPDWTRPQDGTGYQNGKGRHGAQGQFGNGQGFSGRGQRLSRSSFRRGRGLFGTGVCDGTGPKGNARRGNR